MASSYLLHSEIRHPPTLTGPERHHVCIIYSPELELSARELLSKIVYNKFTASKILMSSTANDVCLAVDQCLCTVMLISGSENCVDDHVQQVYNVAKKKHKARASNKTRASSYITFVVYTESVLSTTAWDKLYKCCFKSYDDRETADAICTYTLESYENNTKLKLAVGDVANGMALNYFYGYLNLLMSVTDGVGPKDRLRKHGLWQQNAADRNMALRMFIIISESCFSPPKLSSWDAAIIDGVAYTEFSATRGGCIKRDYKSTIHKLDKNGETLYFVGEIAAPILALYDMAKNDICELSDVEKRCQMSQFYFILSNILAHHGSTCSSYFELVYYNDEGDTTTRPSLSDVLYERIKAAIAKDLEEERDETPLKLPDSAKSDTFIPTAAKHAPGFYSSEVLPKYPVKKTNRGIALIINNEKFESNSQRLGADVDFKKLKALMTKLNFEVIAHENLTTSEMRHKIQDVARRDHTNFDCFMCFVLSHGEFGCVYGVDDTSLPVADIMRSFSKLKCPSLVGKPKCFFLPHCQVSTSLDVSMSPEQQIQQLSREVQDDGRRQTVARSGTDVMDIDANVVQTEELVRQESLSDNTPIDEDFLVSYGTLPGNYAYRHAEDGSFYVQAFVETMESLGSQLHLNDVLQSVTTKVKDKIAEYNTAEGQGASQHPYTISVLSKQLFLPFSDISAE